MVGTLGSDTKAAILGSLRLDDSYMTTLNAKDHSSYARSRGLYATFRNDDGTTWIPNHRGKPWDPGWRELVPGPRPTMTTFRESQPNILTTSSFQAAPKHCLVNSEFKGDTYLQAIP